MHTSRHQFEILVTYMEQHGDLSKPTSNTRSRVVALQKWDELTSLLNSDSSGDTKTTEKWKKVWSDFKNNTKKKAARLHRAAQGTGGGPAVYARLTNSERRVLNLIGIQVATGSAIAETGLPQENVAKEIHEQPQEVQHEIASKSVTEPESSTEIPCVAGHSSQYHIRDLQLSQTPKEVHINESPKPVISPPAIVVNVVKEEIIENPEEMKCSTPAPSPQNMAAASIPQPAPLGQTAPRRSLRFSSLQTRSVNQRFRRRHVRRQVNVMKQAAENFLHSDAEWRTFRIQQHRDTMELRRESNRIRELEIRSQREWQVIGLRVVDLLDKLVNKFCKD